LSWHIPNIMMLAADRLTQFLYWSTKGRLGERQLSYSVLLLHTIGRKTGKRRTHALLYFRAGDNLVVCASNNGSDRLPARYLNLQAHPRVWIQHGRRQREVLAETRYIALTRRGMPCVCLVGGQRRGTHRDIQRTATMLYCTVIMMALMRPVYRTLFIALTEK